MKVRNRGLAGTLTLYAVLIVWAFIVLFPFYWLFTTSFKRPLDVNRVPRYIPFVDFQPITDHWEFLLDTQREQTFRHLRNSLIAAVSATIATTIIGTMAGYGLSRFKYYWARLGWRNDNIAYWIISQRFLPPAVLVIPFLLMYNALGLVDTHFGLAFAYTAFNLPFTVWIMRDFFNGLPIELEESARVDGATRFETFLRIVLPLSGPGLITSALFTFIFSWNEYLFALMLTNINAITMPVLIAAQNSTRGTEWWYVGALTILAVAPVVLLGLFLTRYITRGLVAGAIRG
jgi:multiple sugar transport system permease protein